jgi:sarcosine oxidase subunit alpha
MPDRITLRVNEISVAVPEGCTVAAAVLREDVPSFRRSVTGEARGPLCGMGICFECRVTIDGVAHIRSCQTVCENGMDVRTNE